MKNVLSASICVFLFYILQSSAFKALSFGGAVPNLLLIACVSYGFMRGQRSAMWVGFFGGLLLDIFSMNVLGMNALFYLFAGFAAGLTNTWYDPKEIRVPLLSVFVFDLLLGLVRFLFFYVMNGDFRFRYYVLLRLLPELVATMLLALVFYPLLLWVEERLIRPDTDEKIRQAESDMAALAESDGKEL